MSWFTRRNAKTTTTTTTPRTTLSLNQLESREVPASLKSSFNPVAAAHANPNAAAHANVRAAIVSPTPPVPTTAIAGFVYFDQDASGSLTPSDTLVNGAIEPHQVILRENGVEIQSKSLTQNGTFAFDPVALNGSSTYTVVIDANIVNGPILVSTGALPVNVVIAE
jgi:hypothetical protein